MLNQIILVGRIFGDVKLEEGNVGMVTLAIPRTYKNEAGEYETDLVDVTLFGNVATNTKEFVRTGDIIGIKGRIETDPVNRQIKIIAEKLTFLSNRKEVNE